MSTDQGSAGGRRRPSGAVRFVRVTLPLGMLVLGVALLAIDTSTWVYAIGLILVIAAPLTWFANVLIRLTISSQDDRDREAAARKEYARTHHWPKSSR